MEDNRQTLCWRCKNTNRFKCTWFDPKNPRPVEGWEAIQRDLYVDTRRVESYFVVSCPNFDPEERVEPPINPVHVGVVRRNGKWIATISKKRKFYYLGRFDTKEEAIAARKKAEEMLRDA